MNDSTVNNVTVMDGAATSQLLSGLLKGTVYNVTVIATNSAGESPASVSMQQRTDVDRKWYTLYTCSMFQAYNN